MKVKTLNERKNPMTKRKATTALNVTPISPIDRVVKELDMVACEMETRWGSGTLPQLAAPDTCAKFLRAMKRFDDALESKDYDTVKAAVENLIKGWRKLEQEALAAGHSAQPNAWYVTSPEANGVEYIVAKNELDASLLAARFPTKASSIYTLQQIAALIDSQSVTKLTPREKSYFRDMAKKNSDPLPNDEIPW